LDSLDLSDQNRLTQLMIGIAGLLIAMLISVSISSCGGDSNRANILPPDIQYAADTMFGHRRRVIQLELDSLCMIRKDSLISAKVDSIISKERQSIKNIIGTE